MTKFSYKVRDKGDRVEKTWNGKEALKQYFGSPRRYYDLILLDSKTSRSAASV